MFDFANRVATVWTSEVDLINKQLFDIPWLYVIGDTVDCTSNDNTALNCPVGGEYDVTLNLGFSGLASNTNLKVNIVSDTKGVLISKQFANVKNTLKVDLPNQIFQTDEVIRVTLEFDKIQACGILMPSRTYLRIDSTGHAMAQRMADYFYNTLGNMVYYSGVEMRLQKDEGNKPAVVADTWSTN